MRMTEVEKALAVSAVEEKKSQFVTSVKSIPLDAIAQ